MPVKLIKKLFPNMNQLQNNSYLVSVFGDMMHRQNLWHINRNSISRGVAIGFFCAFIPIPMQILLAILLAIFLRGNIAISAISVWVSNPLTITPMFYFCYELGALLLGTESNIFVFEFTWDWIKTSFISVWKPFLLGCIICACSAAMIGYFSVRLYWRYYVISYWRQRSKLN